MKQYLSGFKVHVKMFSLLFTTFLLSGIYYHAHAQSFQLLGGIDPNTNEQYYYTQDYVFSADGRVICGKVANINSYVLTVDGIRVPLTLQSDITIVGISGDGSTLLGEYDCQDLGICKNVPVTYDWQKKEYNWLPYEIPEIGTTFQGVGQHLISHDGSVVVATFRMHPRPPAPQSLWHLTYRWRNGVMETISVVKGSVEQLNTETGFESVKYMSDDGNVLVGMGSYANGKFNILKFESSFSTIDYAEPDGIVDVVGINDVTPDLKYMVGSGFFPGSGILAVRIADGVAHSLEHLNLRPGSNSVVGRFITSDGGRVFSSGGTWTIWEEGLDVKSVGDYFLNDMDFNLLGINSFAIMGLDRSNAVYGFGYVPEISGYRAWKAVLQPAQEQLTVNSTADRPNNSDDPTICDTGILIEVDGKMVPECTLRAALEAAAARDEATISFNIPGNGIHTITPESLLPEVPGQTILDATTQPGFEGSPRIALYGGNALETAFNLSQNESAIKGFAIGGFTGTAITISGNQNSLEHSFIGVAPDGISPTPNGEGVRIFGGEGNLIGHPEGESANLISANLGHGVFISGEAGKENKVTASYIGTDISGNTALPNMGHGILIEDASGNIIGSHEESTRNQISGNLGSGIVISGSNAKANQVLGNFIGVNIAGNDSLPNGEYGILVESGASENQIGAGTSTTGKAPGNIISGNKLSGIMITGTPEIPGNGNKVQGNFIGLNAAGTETIPNGETGVHVQGQAEETSVGGESASEGNVIAGHSRFNIWIEDQEEALPISPLIGNNLIGTTSTGNSLALPRTPTGIQIGRFDAVVEVLGVPLYKIKNNVVAGSNNNIGIQGDLSESGEITGNNIGLFKNGNIALQDSTQGNLVVLGGSHVQIGKPGQGNHIGGANVGILLAASESYVAGNHIGVNPAGNQARPNNYGIIIPGSVSDGAQTLISSTGRKNIIGGTPAENGELQPGENIIAGNVHAGVMIYSEWGTGEDNLKSKTLKSGNPSGNNSPLPANKFLAQNEPWMAADSNIIIGNKIGLTASGAAMGNGRNAIEEQRSGGLEITRGNGNMVLANEIGANGLGIGIYQTEGSIYAPGTVYISGNYIGTRSVGQNLVARPNQSGGIISLTSSPVVIGIEESNPLMQAPNIIAHNLEYGIRAMRYEDTGAGEGNISVRGNMIAQNEKGPYLVAISEEVTGSDVPGVPNFPELLSASVDSAMVKISGNAESLGMVDFYSGTLDQYDFAVATSSFKTSLSLEENTNFRAEASVEQMPLSAGDYISATLSIGATEEIPMTSHFSPVIRVAKAENVIESLFDGEDTGDLLSGLGITVSKEEGGEELQEEKSAQINSYNTSGNPKNAGQTSGSELHATLHELAPGFNIFDGDAISAGGTQYVAPDTLLASHYWTLAGSNINTGGFYVCLDVSDIDLQELFGGFDGTNPEERTASELVVLQRSYPGAPWTPGDSWFGNNGQSVCTNVLTPTGDFALGFNAQGNATPKTGPQVTFEVTDQFGNKIDDAAIILDGHQQPSGQYRFREIASGNYSYTVSSAGFYDAQGSFTVDQQDISISVTLESINTGIEYFEKEQFLAFPNPNKGSFTLKWNNLQAKEIRISDLQGRTVLQQNIPEFTPEIQVNLPNPVPGIYIVRLYANEKIIYRQILIK